LRANFLASKFVSFKYSWTLDVAYCVYFYFYLALGNYDDLNYIPDVDEPLVK